MLVRRASFGVAALVMLVASVFTGGNPAISSPTSAMVDDAFTLTTTAGSDPAQAAANPASAAGGPGHAAAVTGIDPAALPAGMPVPGTTVASAGPEAVLTSTGSAFAGEATPSGVRSPNNWRVARIGFPMASDDPAEASRKVVMLTFDDGPHPEYTDRILQVLRQHQVPAMFFVTGYGAKNEDVLLRVAADGHVIGTHTVWHKNLRHMTREQQWEAIVPVNKTVERLTGQKVRFFRPPFGAYNDDTIALMKEHNLELLNWSHGSRDWVGVDAHGHKDPAEITADVLAAEPRQPGSTTLHPGAVILLHDVHRHTAEALPGIIQGIRAQGYEFVVMTDGAPLAAP